MAQMVRGELDRRCSLDLYGPRFTRKMPLHPGVAVMVCSPGCWVASAGRTQKPCLPLRCRDAELSETERLCCSSADVQGSTPPRAGAAMCRHLLHLLLPSSRDFVCTEARLHFSDYTCWHGATLSRACASTSHSSCLWLVLLQERGED